MGQVSTFGGIGRGEQTHDERTGGQVNVWTGQDGYIDPTFVGGDMIATVVKLADFSSSGALSNAHASVNTSTRVINPQMIKNWSGTIIARGTDVETKIAIIQRYTTSQTATTPPNSYGLSSFLLGSGSNRMAFTLQIRNIRNWMGTRFYNTSSRFDLRASEANFTNVTIGIQKFGAGLSGTLYFEILERI